MFPCNGILFGNKIKVLTQATTRVNPESIMLSELSQAQKTTYSITPLTGKYKYTNIQRPKNSGYFGLGQKQGLTVKGA